MAVDYTKRPSTSGQAQQVSEGGGSPSKVTLTKSAPSVSLTKGAPATGSLRVNLNWNARPDGATTGGGGFFKRRAAEPSIDLDLGCLYEFTDGSKGVVQALGGAFTSRQSFSANPVLRLDGDDRSGTTSGGENLFVDLAQSRQIRRVLVFAFIYEGTPNWAAADGVVTLFPPGAAPVEVRLDEPDSGSPMCAIAMLEDVDGALQVRREVRYVRGGQQALDKAYAWGMSWASGRK